MSYWRSVVLVAMLGCGGASKKEPMELGEPVAEPVEAPVAAPAPAPAVASSCADAGANVTALTQHVTSSLGPTVNARCQADRWAPEVVQCFASVADGPGLSLCTAMLPLEQQRALESQSVQVVRAADPACTALLSRPVTPAPSPAAPAAPTQGGGAAAPVLSLPGLGAGAASAGAPAAPAPAAAAAPSGSPSGSSAGSAGAAGVAGLPLAARRTISARELEQLRISGETQLEPPPVERRLLAQCNLARVTASYKVCLDGAGAPALVELARSSRLPGYDEKLATAIASWRYRPYLVDGRATAVCSTVTIAYALPPG